MKLLRTGAIALALGAAPLLAAPAWAGPVAVGTTVAFTLDDAQAPKAQAALDRVLVHEPQRTPGEIRVVPTPQGPAVAFGPTVVATVSKAAAARLGYARPEALALAWAGRLASLVSRYQAGRSLPRRVLYHSAQGSDFVYVRTSETLAPTASLTDTGYVFSPDDFAYGAGAKPAGQAGYAVFVADDALAMPRSVYLNPGGGPFTAYRLAEDDLP